MRNILNNLTIHTKITLLFTLLLLFLISIIANTSRETRAPRSQAATGSKTFSVGSSSGMLFWDHTSFPADPSGSCTKVAGRYFIGANPYQITGGVRFRTFRSYITFNTSAIPDDATLTSAKLQMKKGINVISNNFNIYVRDSNWPNKKGLACEDYGGDPPKKKLVSSSFDTANLLPSFDVLFSNVVTISKTGNSSFMVTSSREEADTNQFSTNILQIAGDIKLIVNYNLPPVPSVDIRANSSNGPITISYNSSATLSWSTNTTIATCNATGSWSGSKSTSGSISTGNLTSAKTYTLTCSNSSGSGSDSVKVNVSDLPPPPDNGGGGTPPPNDEGGTPTTPVPGSGLPALPPPPVSIPGMAETIDPNIVNFLRLQIAVPYLLGKIKIPVQIGGYSHELEISPGTNEYEVDVRGAKFSLGSNLTVVVGGNKILIKRVNIKTKAPKQPVKIGNLILGDTNRDNKINDDDITTFLESLKNKESNQDFNLDGVSNSLDWAILLVNFGRIGNR